MSERIITLFGEEIVAQEAPPATRGRAKKLQEDTQVSIAVAEVQENIDVNVEDDGRKYYSIGEVAGIFNIKTSNIRFWTIEFSIKVRTTRKGDRLYTAGQIRTLRAIYNLVKVRGFTLAGAKAKLKEPNGLEIEALDLKQSLVLLKNKLLAIRDQI
jgi:DNA-binding transcriptional MerR regulator